MGGHPLREFPSRGYLTTQRGVSYRKISILQVVDPLEVSLLEAMMLSCRMVVDYLPTWVSKDQAVRSAQESRSPDILRLKSAASKFAQSRWLE